MMTLLDRAACVIFGINDHELDVYPMAIIQSTQWSTSPAFFSLTTEPAHFDQILYSMEFDNHLLPDPTPAPGPGIQTPDPGTIPADIQPSTQTVSGLTIEEYPIVNSVLDSPGHYEFKSHIPATVFDRRQSWRLPSEEQKLAEANTVLSPFGYRLEQVGTAVDPHFTLYQGSKSRMQDITHFWPASVNESQTNFAMRFEFLNGHQWLVQGDAVSQWDTIPHLSTSPEYVRDHLDTLVWDPVNSKVVVQQDGVPIYQFNALLTVKNPVEAFIVADDYWALEIDRFLIIVGVNQNKPLDVDQIFGFTIIQGKPFYFFSKDSVIKASYAGKMLPVEYHQVIHCLCCEPAMFNNGSSAEMVWFYALKGDIWNYMEIGIYTQ